MTSQFGSGRSYNGGPVTSFHRGVDYGGNAGDPVLAAAPGRVSWTGAMPLRGNSVIIDHGAGVKTGYHHLSAIGVAVDDVVAAGDVIGELGSTGVSTGPHLHWEVSVHGVNVESVLVDLQLVPGRRELQPSNADRVCARVTIAAVSTRNLRGPRLTGSAPSSTSRSRSSGVQPPSGPT